MSHIVKHSDLTHLFTGGLYSGFREALNGEEPPLRGENDFLVEQARLFEERINTKLELFGPRGGVNFSGYNSDGCLVPKRNVRMIAERSGDNPATKIFLTVYDSSWFFCYAIDDQNQFRIDNHKGWFLQILSSWFKQ